MAYNQVADIMRALGQNPTNKDVTKILGNPTADGKTPVHGCEMQTSTGILCKIQNVVLLLLNVTWPHFMLRRKLVVDSWSNWPF